MNEDLQELLSLLLNGNPNEAVKTASTIIFEMSQDVSHLKQTAYARQAYH